MKMSKIFKRFLSLTLVACLLLTNISIADVINESENHVSTTEESVQEQKDETTVESEETTTTAEETTATEEETTTVVEETTSNEDTDASEESSKNEATEASETTDESSDSEESSANETTVTEATTTEESVSTGSEASNIVNEEVQVATESEIATTSELPSNELGLAEYYKVVYHFVMPDDASTRGAYWLDRYDTDRYRTVDKIYYIEEKYDETAKETTNGMGLLRNVDLSAILKGYKLIGWNTNEEEAKNGTAKYGISPAKDSPLTKEANVTIDLYSTFELIPMTLKFDINDSTKGTGSTKANKSSFQEVQLCLGDSLSFLDNDEYTDKTISRPGYDFMGWSRECYNSIWRNLTYTTDDRYPITPYDLISSDETFKPNLANGDSTIKEGNTYILYAVWQPKTYQVKIHWPLNCPKGSTFNEYLGFARKAVAMNQWFIFDNDFEVDQSLNHIMEVDSPNRNWDMTFIPSQYLLGIGTDPNCTDASSVVWSHDSYWGHLIPEDLTPSEDGFVHLYCILAENVYASSVNVKVDLDGGYHRGFLSYDARVPSGTSYMKSLYSGLMSNLEKPGYVYDKTVVVDADGNESDFDFNQIASAKDKSQESLDALAAYDEFIAPATEAYKKYFAILEERLALQKIYLVNDNPTKQQVTTWEEFIAIPEVAEVIARENAAYKEYEEIAKNLPNKRDTWDLFLKIKWKGKNLEGKIDYHGNRGNAYKIGPANILDITSKTVTYGEPIGELPTPTMTGYNFKGWKTGRSLFDQDMWKDVTTTTIFESAEKDEPFLFGLKYDEKQFTFYADWEPISLNENAKIENDTSHSGAVVTMNEFKFGEETVLDIKGTYSSKVLSGLYGATPVQEAYGIEVLNDFYTDNGTPVQMQVAGTKYNNGDKVTLYGTPENPLKVKPLWRTKETADDDTTDNTNTNNKDTTTDNTNKDTTTDNTNKNNNNDSGNSSDAYDNSNKDTSGSNANPSSSSPSSNTPSSSGPSNSGSSNKSSSTGSSTGGSSSNSLAALPTQATNNKPQQTLQQTISNGNFAKSNVNTRNISVKKLAMGTNTWTTDPATGKYKLSGISTTGQSISAQNTFAQIDRVVTEGALAGVTVTDTYFFDTNGNMVTGWMQTQDGKWYFFDDTKGSNEGKMSLGWTKVANSWYYFTENGSMLTNGTTPDGFKVNADGTWTQV